MHDPLKHVIEHDPPALRRAIEEAYPDWEPERQNAYWSFLMNGGADAIPKWYWRDLPEGIRQVYLAGKTDLDSAIAHAWEDRDRYHRFVEQRGLTEQRNIIANPAPAPKPARDPVLDRGVLREVERKALQSVRRSIPPL